MATRYKITLQDTPLTSGKVPVATTNGRLTDGGATTTELSYLSGVTSAIQTQIDAKAMVLISTSVASGAATVDFTGLSSTYNNYVVFITDLIPATTGTTLFLRVGTGGTPTYQSGATDYAWTQTSVNTKVGAFTTPTTLLFGDGNDAQIFLSIANAVSTVLTAVPYNGVIYIHNPSHSSGYHHIEYSCSYLGGDSMVTQQGNGLYLSSTAVTAIRFLMSSGNISGNFKLYGLL